MQDTAIPSCIPALQFIRASYAMVKLLSAITSCKRARSRVTSSGEQTWQSSMIPQHSHQSCLDIESTRDLQEDLKRHPWTQPVMKSVVHSRYSNLLAEISLEKLSTCHQNSSATDTVTIKPECLAHS